MDYNICVPEHFYGLTYMCNTMYCITTMIVVQTSTLLATCDTERIK